MCTSYKYCENFVGRFSLCLAWRSAWLVCGAGSAAADWLLTAPTSAGAGDGGASPGPAWRCHTSHVTHWDTCHVAPTLHTGTRGTCHVAPHSGTRVTITIRGSASRSCVIHCELKLPCYKPDLTAAATCAMWRVTCLVWRVVRTMVRVGAEEIWLITRGTADPAPDQRYK